MTLIVALDANTWISQRLLRSKLGATFLFALQKQAGKIVLPRVIRHETIKKLLNIGTGAVDNVQNGLLTLGALVGETPDVQLPTAEVIRRAIDDRLADLGGLIMTLDPTPDDYERAIARVIDARPPNSERKEQFRDSLILEQLLSNFATDEVFFVTNDSDFVFRDGSVLRPLQEELDERGAKLQIVRELEDVLKALGEAATLPDKDEILLALSEGVLHELLDHARKNGYDFGSVRASTLEAFATEDHQRLIVKFKIEWFADNIPLPDGTVVSGGGVTTEGSAFYNISSKSASDVRLERVALSTASGEPIAQTVYAIGAIQIGRRTSPFRIEAPLQKRGKWK